MNENFFWIKDFNRKILRFKMQCSHLWLKRFLQMFTLRFTYIWRHLNTFVWKKASDLKPLFSSVDTCMYIILCSRPNHYHSMKNPSRYGTEQSASALKIWFRPFYPLRRILLLRPLATGRVLLSLCGVTTAKLRERLHALSTRHCVSLL